MNRFKLHRHIPFVRRPFFQRDQAIRERDFAMAERDFAMAERNSLLAERDQLITALEVAVARYDAAVAQHDAARNAVLLAAYARSLNPSHISDVDLVARIVAAYRASVATLYNKSSSFWDGVFFEIKRDVHDALMASDAATVQTMLRDPGTTDLFYGFDNLCRRQLQQPTDEHDAVELMYLTILQLCEALGRPLRNPEAPPVVPLPPADALVASLDVRADFPNPFPDEIGIATSRGVASYRAVQAIYQAHRIVALVGAGSRVLEIGAGLGRTAYYCSKFDISDYTLVDIPLTAVAQGYFLGRTLGPDAVCLFGEDRPGIRLLPPSGFLDSDDRYDIIVNVDSLTELDPELAYAYCASIKQRAGIFLSINHEVNAFTVREICARVGMTASSRVPCWTRHGYVEEVFTSQR